MSGTPLLTAESVLEMQARHVVPPPTLLADWWGLGPYGKHWQGGDVLGHSGTNIAGSSYLLWAPDHDLAVATTVNCPDLGYPFADRVLRELFGRLAGLAPPPRPKPDEGVEIQVERLVGTYAMSGSTLEITSAGGQLLVAASGVLSNSETPSRLLPLSTDTFLPTDPAIDGNRGWALAFVGPDEGQATHVVNGFFSYRRVG